MAKISITKGGSIRNVKLIVLMLGIAFMMVPFSASAGLYTSRTSWEAAVDGFAEVALPGNDLDPLTAFTPIALPFGGYFRCEEDLLRVDFSTSWITWSPNTPDPTKLLYASSFDGSAATNDLRYFANFTFFPDGVSNGPVPHFGFEAQPNITLPFDILLHTNTNQDILQTVDGNGGAMFFGWTGLDVNSFTVSCFGESEGFAMGRFVEGIVKGTVPVPEPASMLLLGFGIIGLTAFKKKIIS